MVPGNVIAKLKCCLAATTMPIQVVKDLPVLNGKSCMCPQQLHGLHTAKQCQLGTLPRNTITDFRVELPEHIVLHNNDYKVAVAKFTYPHTLHNVPDLVGQMHMAVMSSLSYRASLATARGIHL